MEHIIIKSSFHNTDYINNNINRIESKEEGIKERIEEYIYQVIEQTLDSKNTKYYKQQRDTTEVISLASESIKSSCLLLSTTINEDEVAAEMQTDLFEEISDNIAKRLISSEKKGNKNSANLKSSVKRGSVIQSNVKTTYDGVQSYMYVIAKVEYVEGFDKEKFNDTSILPKDNKVLKTCIIRYNDDHDIEDIMLTDKESNIRKYWYDDFLELISITNDEENTKKSFEEIDRVLSRNIKSKSPSDYIILRNELIGYYKRNDNFTFTNMVDTVLKTHMPENESVINMEEIIKKVEKLVDSKKFDNQFEIKRDIIKNKIKKVISVNNEIDLTLKSNIDNLRGTIYSEKADEGEYKLIIKVDKKVYDQFRRK